MEEENKDFRIKENSISIEDDSLHTLATMTATAILIVLAATALMFLQADRVHAFLGKGVTRVISTFLGLITISWGIGFLRDALAF